MHEEDYVYGWKSFMMSRQTQLTDKAIMLTDGLSVNAEHELGSKIIQHHMNDELVLK